MTDEARQQPARDPSSVFEILGQLAADGYDGDLYAVEGGTVRCGSCGTESPAEALDVAELRRMEGASDPADMVAIVAIPCPSCGQRGTIVLAYGPEAGAADSDVLAALPTPAAPAERPGGAA